MPPKSGGKNQPPAVTVLMSVYNGQEHLGQAIDSILNQTFTDFEFLIIDDGSTDGSRAIIESFTDPRIRLIARANKGLPASLNEGLTEALGRYIARQDADDVSEPDRLEREFEYLEANPEAGIVGTNFIIINDFGDWMVKTKVFTHPDDLAVAQLLSNQFGHGSVMMNKEIVQKAGGYDAKVGYVEDYDLFCRISHVAKLANLKEPGYRWRRLQRGISLSNDQLQKEQAFIVRDREFKEYFLKRRNQFKLFSSFHPLSIGPNPLRYFDKKGAVMRDLAWLYRREGDRGQALTLLLLATLLSPWKKRNLRFMYRLLKSGGKTPLWKYEFI